MTASARLHPSILQTFALCALLAAAPARASCSRLIAAVYSTQPVADAYAAQPDRGLPSLHYAISKASGCTLNVAIDPPARAWQDFNNGQIDLLLSTPPAHDEGDHGTFLPMLKSPWVLVTALPESGTPRRLEEFVADRHLLVSKIRGLPYPPDVTAVLDRLQKQQQIDEAVEVDQALDKLGARRDAAMIMTAGAYLLHLDKIRAIHARHIVQNQFAPAILGIYISRKALPADDRATLTSATQAVIKSGLPVRLLRSHLGGDDDGNLVQSP